MKTIYALLCAGLLAVAACSTASYETELVANGGKKLSNQDLTALFSKPVVYNYWFVRYPGARGTVATQPGGTVTLDWMDVGSYDDRTNATKGQDSGTWRIEGDTFCTKWKEVNKAQENCSTWVMTKENSYTTVRANGKAGANIVVNP